MRNFIKFFHRFFYILNMLNTMTSIYQVKFINSLESKGIVETVSKSVTHIVVGTDADLRAQRTTKYLMGIAAGRLIVSHKWIEACLRDPKNLLNAKDFEVTDAELDGANGPWKARIARLACHSPLL